MSSDAPKVPAAGRVARFVASMNLSYEKWREGEGYAVDLIAEAAPDEAARIEEILVSRGVSGWREVEALARLDTARARTVLRAAFLQGDAEVRAAVLRFTPDLASEDEVVAHLVRGLETAEFYRGLSAVLDLVTQVHPPPVIAALRRGLRGREGGVACHFAAMLMYLHGHAREPFDWSQRPFYLRFTTDDPAAREAACRELEERIAEAGPHGAR